jgi:hypothetical protein
MYMPTGVSGSCRWFQLEGQAAVDAFTAGITLLHAELELLTANPGAAGLSEAELAAHVAACSSEISTAFCSVAELYLTDLCDQDGAQEACINCAERALQFDPRNVQAMQVGPGAGCWWGLVCVFFFVSVVAGWRDISSYSFRPADHGQLVGEPAAARGGAGLAAAVAGRVVPAAGGRRRRRRHGRRRRRRHRRGGGGGRQ